MTEERLVLAELLEKAGDGDFLRAVAEAVLQLLMETDVEGADRRRALRAQRRADHLAQWLPRPHPRHPAWRAAAAHPEVAAGQLFPTVSRSSQELGEGADRGDPGGVDRGGGVPPGARA